MELRDVKVAQLSWAACCPAARPELALSFVSQLEADEPNLPEVLNCTSLTLPSLLPVQIRPVRGDLCVARSCAFSQNTGQVLPTFHLTGHRLAGSFVELGIIAGTST